MRKKLKVVEDKGVIGPRTLFGVVPHTREHHPLVEGTLLYWLEKFFDSNLKKNWNFLFNFLPQNLYNTPKKKSAIISLLLASLNNVKDGKIEMNQNKHYDNIMIKLK